MLVAQVSDGARARRGAWRCSAISASGRRAWTATPPCHVPARTGTEVLIEAARRVGDAGVELDDLAIRGRPSTTSSSRSPGTERARRGERPERTRPGRQGEAGRVEDGLVTTIPLERSAVARRARSVTFGDLVGDTLAIAKRNLLRIQRTPQLLVFLSIQPVMFVLLFRYVFGGAIATPGYSYVDYLMAGIFVQTSLFGGASTAVGLAEDLKAGIIDRFRSLPMARSAVLIGRTLADFVRSLFVVTLMILVGVLVGFRFTNGFWPAVGAIALVLAFGYAFSWVFAAIGLAVRDPETAQIAGFIPLFPFIFASAAFVPVSSMPGWLQGFASNQPVSVVIQAVRGLTHGGEPIFHLVWVSLVWTLGVLLVAMLLAFLAYRRD